MSNVSNVLNGQNGAYEKERHAASQKNHTSAVTREEALIKKAQAERMRREKEEAQGRAPTRGGKLIKSKKKRTTKKKPKRTLKRKVKRKTNKK